MRRLDAKCAKGENIFREVGLAGVGDKVAVREVLR